MAPARIEVRALARLAACVIVFAVAAGSPRPAAAQPDHPEAKRMAIQLLQSGDRKLKRGERLMQREQPERAREKFAEALADYEAAFDAFPQPKIYFPIAQAEQKLGRYLDAYRHYKQCLDEVPDLKRRVKRRIRVHIKEVQKELGAIRFVVVPDGALVSVDGAEIGTTPFEEPYWTTAGEHTYEVSSEGYTPVEKTVNLERGQVVEQAVTLEEVPEGVEPPKPTVKKEEIDRPQGPSRLPLWIGLGATGALAAGATVTGILAVSRHGTFTDESKPPNRRANAKDSGETLALTTDLLLLGTLAAGAYTAYHYYWNYRPKQERYEAERDSAGSESQPPSVWMTPYAARRGAGLAVGGRF